jgi:hypothetical protein
VQEFSKGLKTMMNQSEDYAEMNDVVIIDEERVQLFETLLESFMLNLLEFFQTIVNLNIPELKYNNLVEVFDNNLFDLLEIIAVNIVRIPGNLRKKMSLFLLQLSAQDTKEVRARERLKAQEILEKNNIKEEQFAPPEQTKSSIVPFF